MRTLGLDEVSFFMGAEKPEFGKKIENKVVFAVFSKRVDPILFGYSQLGIIGIDLSLFPNGFLGEVHSRPC